MLTWAQLAALPFQVSVASASSSTHRLLCRLSPSTKPSQHSMNWNTSFTSHESLYCLGQMIQDELILEVLLPTYRSIWTLFSEFELNYTPNVCNLEFELSAAEHLWRKLLWQRYSGGCGHTQEFLKCSFFTRSFHHKLQENINTLDNSCQGTSRQEGEASTWESSLKSNTNHTWDYCYTLGVEYV